MSITPINARYYPHPQELEKLHDMLEETASTTATQQEIRAKRESELAALKNTLQEEMASSEASHTSMRQKHVRAMEELNEQLDTLKKVSIPINAHCMCGYSVLWQCVHVHKCK